MSRPLPGAVDQPLRRHLARRLPPSESRVSDVFRETTVCYAYMCSYAYACSEKSRRPAQVLTRRCMRYLPEEMRVAPALSDYMLDLLARGRERGLSLSPATRAILDRLRPNGPLRRA